MKNATNKLLKNSFIYTIANFGTKFFSLIMVVFYTYVLTTEEYGIVDLITTTITLVLPIITLYIHDGTMRFTLDKKYDNDRVLSISMLIFIFSIILGFIIVLFANQMFNTPFNLTFLYSILVLQGLFNIWGQFIRGKGELWTFALGGVVNTFFLLIFNIIFLFVFRLGILGYLISLFLSQLVADLYYFFKGKIWKSFHFNLFNKKVAKAMLIYCIPLIPNAIMWWVINMSDRYMITWMIDSSANGLYAVANKIPSLIVMVTSIFFQAWQITVIEEESSSEKEAYYSKVFAIFFCILMITNSIICLFIKPILQVVLAPSYQGVVQFVPLLLLSSVFSSFSSFFGTYYAMAKKTMGALLSTIVSAIINIILNYILISKLGVQGAIIATLVSMFILWIYRLFDTQKYVKMNYDIVKIILTIVIILLQIGGYFVSGVISYFLQIVCVIGLLWLHKTSLKEIFTMFMKIVKGKIKNERKVKKV